MQSFKKFLGETYLHGCGYVDAENKFFILFWATFTTACVALATNDIVGLVNTYQSVPFQVTLTPKSNNNISLPTPTLCMEIMVVPPATVISPDKIKSDIQAFMHKTANGTYQQFLSGVDMGLSDNLEYLTYMMLGYISDSEMLYISDNDHIYTDYATRYITGKQDVWNLTQTVFDTYSKYDVSLIDLKLLVGTSICQKQFKQAQKGKLLSATLGSLRICQPNTLTHLSFSLVCSQMVDTNTFRTDDFHTVSVGTMVSASDPDSPHKFPPVIMMQMCQPIQLTMLEILKQESHYEIPVYLGIDGSPASIARYLWHLDLQGRSVVPRESLQDTITIDPQIPMQYFDVSIATEFNFYNAPGIRPCVTEESQHQCRWRKLVDRMSQTCGCWPSSIIDLANTNQLPTCSGDASLNPYISNTGPSKNNSGRCDYRLDTSIDDTECPKKCRSFLYTTSLVDVYRHVNLTTMRTPYPVEMVTGAHGSFEVNFQVGSLRTVIEEELTMTFLTFACLFGGTIGTWLGGSILAFLHIPIFIMAELHTSYSKRKKATNDRKTNVNVTTVAREAVYPPASTEVKSL